MQEIYLIHPFPVSCPSSDSSKDGKSCFRILSEETVQKSVEDTYYVCKRMIIMGFFANILLSRKDKLVAVNL